MTSRRIARLATLRAGAVSRAQLFALGLGRGAIGHRVAFEDDRARDASLAARG